jgi:hypothetical protein
MPWSGSQINAGDKSPRNPPIDPHPFWIPTACGEKAEEGAPVTEGDTGAEKEKRSGFIMGTVLDVTQTEPALDGPELYRRAADACAASGQ